MKIKLSQLKHRITQSASELLEGGRHLFIDNGSNVLAIAHVDVHPSISNPTFFNVRGGRVYSPALDDRLGVYVILDLLPELGINVDVLLTTDEEIGKSTAADFIATKKYNWMFQFDRRGTDVVMYEYETLELIDILSDFGFVTGRGSFSDICYLTSLGCAGFNFGTAYHQEHSMSCYADLKDLAEQVTLFQRFFKNLSDIHFEFEDWYFEEDDYDTPKYEDYVLCEVCGSGRDVVYYSNVDSFVCSSCEAYLPEYVHYRMLLDTD